MNRIRKTVLAKMSEDGLDFVEDTVHVVALDFTSGMLQKYPLDFADVLLTVDVTYQTLHGVQMHSSVRIPVEGWSKPWMEIQRAMLECVNGDHQAPVVSADGGVRGESTQNYPKISTPMTLT